MKAITLAVTVTLLASVHAANESERKLAAYEIATSLLCDKTLDKEQYQTCLGVVADEMDVDMDEFVAFAQPAIERNRIPDIDAI